VNSKLIGVVPVTASYIHQHDGLVVLACTLDDSLVCRKESLIDPWGATREIAHHVVVELLALRYGLHELEVVEIRLVRKLVCCGFIGTGCDVVIRLQPGWRLLQRGVENRRATASVTNLREHVLGLLTTLHIHLLLHPTAWPCRSSRPCTRWGPRLRDSPRRRYAASFAAGVLHPHVVGHRAQTLFASWLHSPPSVPTSQSVQQMQWP
jgi:hypothetical protein